MVVGTAGLFGQLVLSWVAKVVGTDVTASPPDPPQHSLLLRDLLFWVCEQIEQVPALVLSVSQPGREDQQIN